MSQPYLRSWRIWLRETTVFSIIIQNNGSYESMKIKYAFNVRMLLVVYITRRLFLVTSMVMKQTSQLVQTLAPYYAIWRHMVGKELKSD